MEESRPEPGQKYANEGKKYECWKKSMTKIKFRGKNWEETQGRISPAQLVLFSSLITYRSDGFVKDCFYAFLCESTAKK